MKKSTPSVRKPAKAPDSRRPGHRSSEPGADDDLLTTPDVARWLGVSVQFLELSRMKNKGGPPYTRLSPRCIRYRRGDVAAWLRKRTHQSTSEYAG